MAAPIAKGFARYMRSVCCGFQQSRMLHTSRPLMSDSTEPQFDESLLEYLACPLSKQPLRYDKSRNELVSDEVGVAYPIINGIPNLVPQDARMLTKDSSSKDSPS